MIPQPDHAPTEAAAASARLLLADDSEASRLIVRLFLQAAPLAVEVAANGREAVEKFCDGGYDLVLMDVQMPEMDGLAATRAIRSWERQHGLPARPIVALSADDEPEAVAQALEAGCTAYLTKPIDRATLLATLARYS